MQWGDQKRDHHPILAVWPEYRPWEGLWRMVELAEVEPNRTEWRDRRIPSPEGHVKIDAYRDEESALAAAAAVNPQLQAQLERRDLPEEIKTSLRLKARKGLQAKERLANEEKMMLAAAVSRHAGASRPSASDLILPPESEEHREALASQLARMPYLRSALVQSGHYMKVLFRENGDKWTKPYTATRRNAQAASRARIANAFGFSGAEHWGKTKAAIRLMLLPRANQLLQLASVKHMLDDALSRGERVLVTGNFVFWYEEDRSVGWIVKSVAPSDDADGTAIWEEGEILSKNHGRIVVLPYIKEDGEMVSGHTKNAPGDGPAKPRHPNHYVTLPFKRLKDDLMLGLFGELPYE